MYAYVNSDPFQATDFEGLDEHHIVPRSLFNNIGLENPETRRVFDRSTITVPQHGWSRSHWQYNNAVRELFNDFCRNRSIEPKAMTPPQAKLFVMKVWNSMDPRIRGFNTNLMMRGLRNLGREGPR